MSDRIEGAAREGLGRVQDGIGGLTGDGKTQAKGKVNEAVGSLQSAYGRATERAQQALGQTRDRAETAYSDVDGYLRRQPLVGLGIGVGVGLLLALILQARSQTIYVRERPLRAA
jgi:uncharacterized protein YjbJ (UPF0337 family)